MALSKILPASQEQYAGARNLIINGGFQCWQRSTDNESTSTSWGYRTVDRFQTNKGRYRKTSDTVDGRTVDVIQIDPSSGVYHGGRGMFTMLEDYNAYDKPTVLSVYIKADAATTADIGQLYDYGGGSTVQAGTTVNITTSWQRFEVQYSAQTFTQAAGHYIINALVDGRTYYVAMAQLETGTQATPFEHRSYGDELARCQRYYYRTPTGQAYQRQCVLTGRGSTSSDGTFILPVSMRSQPTFSKSGTMSVEGNTTKSISSISLSTNASSTDRVRLSVVSASGLTAGYSYYIFNVNDANAYLDFDAEL